jgi:hypothetical protein
MRKSKEFKNNWNWSLKSEGNETEMQESLSMLSPSPTARKYSLCEGSLSGSSEEKH